MAVSINGDGLVGAACVDGALVGGDRGIQQPVAGHVCQTGALGLKLLQGLLAQGTVQFQHKA